MKYLILLFLGLVLFGCSPINQVDDPKDNTQKNNLAGSYVLANNTSLTISILNQSQLSMRTSEFNEVYKGTYYDNNNRFEGSVSYGTDKETMNITYNASTDRVNWTQTLSFTINGKRHNKTNNGSAYRRK